MDLLVNGVTITRGSGRSAVMAVADLTFHVQGGTTLALMGPSGVGKSSVLLAVADRVPLVAGTIQLVDWSKSDIPRTMYVPQDYQIVDFLTAGQNVMLPLEMTGVKALVAQAKAKEAMTALGVGDLFDRRPNDMSGGQRQRVAVARATVVEPAVLLLDEPTAAIDRTTGQAMMAAVVERTKVTGTISVVATHDPAIAELADDVLDMSEANVRGSDDARP